MEDIIGISKCMGGLIFPIELTQTSDVVSERNNEAEQPSRPLLGRPDDQDSLVDRESSLEP